MSPETRKPRQENAVSSCSMEDLVDVVVAAAAASICGYSNQTWRHEHYLHLLIG